MSTAMWVPAFWLLNLQYLKEESFPQKRSAELLKDLPNFQFPMLDTIKLKDWLKTLALPLPQEPLKFFLVPKHPQALSCHVSCDR